MQIVKALYNLEILQKYIELFSICFPKARKFTIEYLQWLYTKNPDGMMIGYNAFDGNKLVCHYACIPVSFMINSKCERALLSLNTATHPDYQGKGLFTSLAKKTYDSAKEEGYSFVYGVANANSTPGFITKLGFQCVRPLDVRLGIGRIKPDYEKIMESAFFRRIWTEESLSWRCANPAKALQLEVINNHFIMARGKVVRFLLNCSGPIPFMLKNDKGFVKTRSLFHLFIGLFPEHSVKFSYYISVPVLFRPSPLNLIYLNLDNRNHVLNPDNLLISFMDFDAY